MQTWPEVLDRLDYCYELFSSSAVVLLGSLKSLAVVSDNHLTFTLDLGQNSSHTVVAGVGVQDVLFDWISIRQNW